jgi:SAM-dependent methyltransferase
MSTYVLGSDEQERHRLAHQGSLLDRITERFLLEAGLEPGMRVLDLGSGVGDVAVKAAQIVGSGGEVVGVDADPVMVETARRRVEAEGLPVHLVDGDVLHLELDEPPFDAAIGRLILMHLPDPTAAVRAAAAHVRPGGIVTFQDFTTAEVRVHPPLPKVQETVDLITETLERLGADTRGGDNLRSIFLAAGLPEPELRLESLIGGGPDDPIFRLVAGVTQTLRPAMERVGLAPPDEVDPERLAAELETEVADARGVLVSPPLVAAWARRVGIDGP